MSSVFGYPEFDKNGEMILTTYDNEYKDMMMDIRVYHMAAGETRKFFRAGEETAVLLLSGKITCRWEQRQETVSRKDVFTEGPWCVHVCKDTAVEVEAAEASEILVQCTKNNREFPARLYSPKDAPWNYSCQGKFGNVAKRRVNTIFDHEISPKSNMVLGEITNFPGIWSSYPPHHHPQPEVYFYKFDHPQGFGSCFIGEDVYKITHNSVAMIPGGLTHPQNAAPGYAMFYVWMIPHLEGNPWIKTRTFDPAHE